MASVKRKAKSSPPESAETRVRAIQQQIGEKYPDLTVSTGGGQIYIRGSFPVFHEGNVLERYQIEIEWSERDSEAPILRETGGMIPRINDRHVNSNGNACPMVPEEWLLRPREERSALHYLDEPVRDYFLWQALTDRGYSPSWGHRSHGVDGLIEAYGEIVGMQGKKAVRLCLEYLSKDRIKGHWPCPCDSGRIVRKCHVEHLRALAQRIPKHVVRLALKRLQYPTMR